MLGLKPLVFAGFLVAATAVTAEPVKQHNSNAIWFVNWTNLTNATLTIAAPSGEITQVFAKEGTPVFKLPGKAEDGIYRFELTAATSEKKKIINFTNSGRGDKQPKEHAVPYYGQGYFVVERGVITTPKEIKEDKDG